MLVHQPQDPAGQGGPIGIRSLRLGMKRMAEGGAQQQRSPCSREPGGAAEVRYHWVMPAHRWLPATAEVRRCMENT